MACKDPSFWLDAAHGHRTPVHAGGSRSPGHVPHDICMLVLHLYSTGGAEEGTCALVN